MHKNSCRQCPGVIDAEQAKTKGAEARAKKWEKLKDSGMTQAAYKKKKKEAAEKNDGQGFKFGSSMRAVKTASTQLLKLKGSVIESIPADERQKLRTELEALSTELEQVLSGF